MRRRNAIRWPGARLSGLVLMAALPLLAGCASVIPESGARPAATVPLSPEPRSPDTGAAAPLPATPNAPLAAPAPSPTAASAIESGVVAGPEYNELGVSADQAMAALQAFRLSCPSIQRRADASGLTQNDEWTESCAAATEWPDRDASNFFSRHFGTVQVGAGTAFVTGYYEPEIAGSRTPTPGYDVRDPAISGS
jgi:membrane-bound lytic murein transglycosylase A